MGRGRFSFVSVQHKKKKTNQPTNQVNRNNNSSLKHKMSRAGRLYLIGPESTSSKVQTKQRHTPTGADPVNPTHFSL